VAHAGHCLEFILADFIARYKTSEGYDVFFNVGLDEAGAKISDAASAANIPVDEYLEDLAIKWIEFCKLFNISYTNFYRTISKDHHDKVQLFWESCLLNGDLYKKEYTAKYCTGCESFKTEKDLINGKCPEHTKLEISEISEENWFFRLTKYKDEIYDFVKKTNFLTPHNKLYELLNQISGAEDISVSRDKSRVSLGVDVPNDDGQIIYVWFSALLNYIIAAGWDGSEDKTLFNSWWKNTLQICGPDNLKFQGLIFQSLLASQNISFTKKLLVHGTITDSNGNKMSKTEGNVIDPISQLNKFGLDAVRYYILAGLNTTANNSWSELDLINLFNSDVVDGVGNLIARTLHLIDINNVEVIEPSALFKDYIDDILIDSRKQLDNYEIKDGIKTANEVVRYCNTYIIEKKPWSDPVNSEEVLSNLYYALTAIADFYQPIFPNRYKDITDALKGKKKAILFAKIK